MMNLSFVLEKADFEQRILEGCISAEIPDKQGDKIQFDAMCQALEAASVIGVREMHQPKAVGVLQKWWGDASTRRVFVRIYISNTRDGEDVLTKVREGVLRGFSIGGRALKWFFEGAVRVITELLLTEISVVDVPANPGALITLVKFAGEEVIQAGTALSSNKQPAAVAAQSFIQPLERTSKMADEILQKGAGTLLGEANKAIQEAMELIASDPDAAKQRLQQVGAALSVMADKATAPANEKEEKPTASVSTAAPSVGSMDKTITPPSMPSSSNGGATASVPSEVVEGMTTMAKAMVALLDKVGALEKKVSPAIPANPAAPAGDIPQRAAAPRSPLQKAMIAGDMSEAQRITGGDLSQMYREVDNLVRESLVKSGIVLGGRFMVVSNPLE